MFTASSCRKAEEILDFVPLFLCLNLIPGDPEQRLATNIHRSLRFEFGHGFEDAADFSLCDGREEAFDGIQPRGRCRREMEGPARMLRGPIQHCGMLVSGVIIENGVGRVLAPEPKPTPSLVNAIIPNPGD
jgi:hypothetical protein